MVSMDVRNRNLQKAASKAISNEVMVQKECNGYYSDDDKVEFGRVYQLIYRLRFFAAFTVMFILTILCAMVLLLMMPWPLKRQRIGNVWGCMYGKLLFWMVGVRVKIEGIEHVRNRAIFICNHASAADVLVLMQLIPFGTVGIAKKEIVWFPVFGQVFWLANHLRIDRSSTSAAVASLKEAGGVVVKNKLSLAIFPEGTRSNNGRLLPFKKGFVHLAMQTRLPVVPIVMIGAHKVWKKGEMVMRPTPMTVKILSPIKTDDWTRDKVNEHLEYVRNLFIEHLPESQWPKSSPS